jgi:hypothetical protein
VAAAGVAAKQARARFSGLGRKRKRDAELSADSGATAPADETTGTQADESTSVASDT